MENIKNDSSASYQPGETMKNLGYVKEYKILKLISNHRTSNVYLCEKGGVKYTMKILIRRNRRKRIYQVIDKFKQLKCNNVVRIIESFEYKKHPCVVMEFLQSTLRQYIRTRDPETKRLPEIEALALFRQLFYGYAEMHQAGLVHDNLTLDCILMRREQQGSNKEWIPILCGVASGEAKRIEGDDMQTQTNVELTYYAPELLNGIPSSFESDIWALGVILFAMVYHDFPFLVSTKPKTMKKYIRHVVEPDFSLERATQHIKNSPTISKELEGLFSKIFISNNNYRMKFQTMLDHPLLLQEMKFPQMPDLYTREFQRMKILESQQIQNKHHEQQQSQQQTFNQEQSKEYQEKVEMTHQQMMEESIIKEDQNEEMYMINSIALCQQLKKFHSSSSSQDAKNKFQTHLDVYNNNIARYTFLIDSYWTIYDNIKFFLVVDGVCHTLVKYFLLRTVLFYAYWLRYILKAKINEFNLPHWEEFLQSQIYQDLIKHVYTDISLYEDEFAKIYPQAKEVQDLIEKEVGQCIVQDIEIEYKQDYGLFPQEYKLPFRGVLLTAFSKLYRFALQLQEGKIDLHTYKEANFQTRTVHLKKEAILRKRLALRMLLCASVNRILDVKKGKFDLSTLQKQNSASFMELEPIFEWMNQISDDNVETEIKQIFDKYFKMNYKKEMIFF